MNAKVIFQIFSVLFCITVNTYGEAPTSDDMHILNVQHLYPFFEKLEKLEKDTAAGKVNIVHIGDSHIQGIFFCNAARNVLQQSFGNGGYGFTFPYGFYREGDSSRTFRFFSNASWRICRNNMPYRCTPGAEFGLAGYGFTTPMEEFVLKIEIVDKRYQFNTIKLVATGEPFPFRPASAIRNVVIKNPPPNLERHVVKRRETLASIAKKYEVSIDSIKDRNRMTSNIIRAGKTLFIPAKVESIKIDMSQFKPLEFHHQERQVATYRQTKPASEAYFIPAVKLPLHNLNGIILENDSRGIIYHGVGTVGSTAAHFNATPLFFEQLHALSPDLFVISFGTNESYHKISAAAYMAQINLMISNIKKFHPNIPIMITTPPTSLLEGKKPNTYVNEYFDSLMRLTNFAVWDLYSFTGGFMGALEKPEIIQIAKDKVHYSPNGYTSQGTTFANAILQNYEQYKQSQKLKE